MSIVTSLYKIPLEYLGKSFLWLQGLMQSFGIVTPLADLLTGGILGATLLGMIFYLVRTAGTNLQYTPGGKHGFFARVRKLWNQQSPDGKKISKAEFVSYMWFPLVGDLIAAAVKLLTGVRRKVLKVTSHNITETVETLKQQLEALRTFTHEQLAEHRELLSKELAELSSASPVKQVEESARVNTDRHRRIEGIDTAEVEVRTSDNTLRSRYNVRIDTHQKFGPYISFHENSLPESEGMFRNDIRVGDWTYYDSHGEKREVTTYNNRGERINSIQY